MSTTANVSNKVSFHTLTSKIATKVGQNLSLHGNSNLAIRVTKCALTALALLVALVPGTVTILAVDGIRYLMHKRANIVQLKTELQRNAEYGPQQLDSNKNNNISTTLKPSENTTSISPFDITNEEVAFDELFSGYFNLPRSPAFLFEESQKPSFEVTVENVDDEIAPIQYGRLSAEDKSKALVHFSPKQQVAVDKTEKAVTSLIHMLKPAKPIRSNKDVTIPDFVMPGKVETAPETKVEVAPTMTVEAPAAPSINKTALLKAAIGATAGIAVLGGYAYLGYLNAQNPGSASKYVAEQFGTATTVLNNVVNSLPSQDEVVATISNLAHSGMEMAAPYALSLAQKINTFSEYLESALSLKLTNETCAFVKQSYVFIDAPKIKNPMINEWKQI
jgi:hypothetical protein